MSVSVCVSLLCAPAHAPNTHCTRTDKISFCSPRGQQGSILGMMGEEEEDAETKKLKAVFAGHFPFQNAYQEH